MIRGIEHVAIASSDPQRLAEWYVRNLDFTIIKRSESVVFIKAANGFLLEIITTNNQLPAPQLKDSGLRHIALAVDDFDKAYERLKTAAVPSLGEPFMADTSKGVFFQDPEGNHLHLIFRPTPFV